MHQKPTIPAVAPLIRAWYSKPGNECGGLFHIILDDGNNEQHWAAEKLEEAKALGEPDAIQLAEMLVKMSPTQRLKLSKMDWMNDDSTKPKDTLELARGIGSSPITATQANDALNNLAN